MPKNIDPQEFLEQLTENEQFMPEQAAFHVACQQFNIDEETGFNLLLSTAGANDNDDIKRI